MKNKYLLCGLLCALTFTACKKEISDNINVTPIPGGKSPDTYKPIEVSELPKLKNLRINGATCGYDMLNKLYYFPVSSGTSLNSYTVNFDSTAAAAVIIDGQRVLSGGTVKFPLTANNNITVRVINSFNTPEDYNLFITNLPIVHLGVSDKIEDEYVHAYFELIDPDYAAHQGKLNVRSDINIRLRGVTARNLPKKSYAVHITDAGGNDKDASLLGLRNDNNWILDAMYIDEARMRNRLCTDIWNSFNNVPYKAQEPEALNGTRGYMVEVFYNNFYNGVYCLTEKLDRKQLKIKKQYGDMYKADDVTDQSNFLDVIPYDNLSKMWGGWELEYPDLGDTPSPEWGYLYDEINFVAKRTDAEFLADIENKVDIDNMVDYFIFMNVIYATDNNAKNLFFSFYDKRTAPAFFYSPWDLDGSMGRNWAGLKVNNIIIGAGTNNLLKRLVNLNAGNFISRVKKRWGGLKINQLSAGAVAGRIEGYKKVLLAAGAFDREVKFTYGIDKNLITEAGYMNSWYAAQLDAFDTYVNKL